VSQDSVKQSEGAIGYVELAYAVKNGLPYAELKNKAGQFVAANFESVSAAAAASAKSLPRTCVFPLPDADGKEAYPISDFTWLLVYKTMKDKEKAERW